MAANEDIEKVVRERFGESVTGSTPFRGELTVGVGRDAIHDVCVFLRDAQELQFDFLADLTAVDYLNMDRSPRFDVVYHLLSLKHGHRLRLKVAVPEDHPHIASVVGIWPAADWYERETYDMFGIVFDGHPDLTRIMMPDDWQGHPLRKDFPVGGARSFYFKRDTQPHAGEPPGLVPRIRVSDSDV